VAVSRPTCNCRTQDARRLRAGDDLERRRLPGMAGAMYWSGLPNRGATAVGRVAVLVARLGLLGEGSGREHESGEGHAKGSLHSHPHASPCCCNIAQRSGPAMRRRLGSVGRTVCGGASSRILSARVGRGNANRL